CQPAMGGIRTVLHRCTGGGTAGLAAARRSGTDAGHRTAMGSTRLAGLVASGLGFFFWNRGATQVDAGTLGIMNNALIPAGLLVNLLIWNQQADLLRLGLGGAVIGLSLWLNLRWDQWLARIRRSASTDL